MPYQATVFNVTIASPGDVEPERDLVREVIYEWNAVHSKARGLVLQPIGWETHAHPSMDDRAQGVLNKQILADADLLVAIFWTRLGTPTGEAVSGTVEEIERHIARGRDAMIYFSSAPVRPESVDAEQYRNLTDFKAQCRAKGLIEGYESPAEFRQLFARHLAARINNSSQFAAAGRGARNGASSPDAPVLHPDAGILLLEATRDGQGEIMTIRTKDGTTIVTNDKQFGDEDPRSSAIWEGALEDLVSRRLVKKVASKSRGDVHKVTREGYEAIELLKASMPELGKSAW